MLWLIIILTLLGLLLLAIEVVIPGMIVGALGILALLSAIAVSYFQYGFAAGTLMLAMILMVTFGGFLFWLYLLPRTFIGRRLILNSAVGKPANPNTEESLVGKTGVALTHLRPSGTVSIDGRRLDVVAETGYVAAHEPVRVVGVEGMRVIVRADRLP